METKNQTAVEWLFEELQGIHPSQIEYLQTFEQAKAMEKSQIVEAYKADMLPMSDEDGEQYYKELDEQLKLLTKEIKRLEAKKRFLYKLRDGIRVYPVNPEEGD